MSKYSLVKSLHTLALQVAPTPHSQPFSLQLVQRALEDSLGPLQRSFHQEIQNLHLELLRQFHMQQVGYFRL